MEIPRHAKRVLACTLFIGLMLFILFAFIQCATLSKFLQVQQESFDLIIGTETFKVILPENLPDMKDATVEIDRCWDAVICQMVFCLVENKPTHDHIHFWYVPGEAPCILVWVREEEIDPDAKYKCWLYVKGVPVSVDLRKVNQVLREKLMPSKTIKLNP